MPSPRKKDAPPPKVVPKTQTKGTGHGWNKYQPTEQDRQIVMLAVAAGLPQERIAKQIRFPEGISVPTLKKHFGEELDAGTDRANLRVMGALFAAAMTPSNKGQVTAAIFWLKTRARWRDQGPLTATAAMTEDGTTGARSFTLKIGERAESDSPNDGEE